MSDATDIEKKSLEAHVELCAQRYRYLEEKLETLEEKMSAVADSVSCIKASIDNMSDKNNDRLLNWSVGVIGFLVSTVGYLFFHYVIK